MFLNDSPFENKPVFPTSRHLVNGELVFLTKFFNERQQEYIPNYSKFWYEIKDEFSRLSKVIRERSNACNVFIIDGNIGSGKSSMINRLNNPSDDMLAFLEPV